MKFYVKPNLTLFCFPTDLKAFQLDKFKYARPGIAIIWKDEMSFIQDHHFIMGASKNTIQKPRTRSAFSKVFVALLEVNIAFKNTLLIQKYTIRLLPTDDQHAKDGVCGKK